MICFYTVKNVLNMIVTLGHKNQPIQWAQLKGQLLALT